MNEDKQAGAAGKERWAVDYLSDTRMIAVTGAGPIADADAKRQSEQAIRLLNETRAERVLVDYGEALSDVSFAVLYWLPRFYRQLGAPAPTRIALVVPRDPRQVESFQFYALACRNAGYNVKLFGSRKAAEEWLRAN